MPFTYNRSLTVDYTLVPSTQTDFPMLVNLTNNDLRTVGNGGNVQHASGYDVCFYSDSGLSSALFWEMESYNPVTGEVVAWVKIPSLSHTVGTVIYLAYGDSGISSFQSTASSVWDSNFKGVWHLPNGTTLSANDSTSGATHGTVGSATAATGQVDGGADTAAGSIALGSDPAALQATTAVTVAAWVKLAVAGSSQAAYSEVIVYPFGNGGANPYVSYGILVNNANFPGAFMFWWGDSNNRQWGLSGEVDTNWHHVAGVGTTSSMKIYIDGLEVSGSHTATGAPVGVISYTSGATPKIGGINGIVDEARVSNAARSADWIATEYVNQNSPSTFYALGAEVQAGSGAARRMLTVPFLGGSRARAF